MQRKCLFNLIPFIDRVNSINQGNASKAHAYTHSQQDKQNYPSRHYKVQTHTCDFDVQVVVQQQILSLQVSVNYVATVTEMDCRHNLLELLQGVLFGHTPMSNQVVCTCKAQFTIKVIKFLPFTCSGHWLLCSRLVNNRVYKIERSMLFPRN